MNDTPFQWNQPGMQMDPRLQRKPGGDLPLGAPAQQPTEIDKFNQWLAGQGGGKTLNVDPTNPSAAVKQFSAGTPPSVGGEGGPAAPSNTFNRGTGSLPSLPPFRPLTAGQPGYMDFHAAAMGTSPDGLRDQLGANPDLGEMLARSDARRNALGEQGANLQMASGGDPTALAKLASPGTGGLSLSPQQAQGVLSGMGQAQGRSLAQQELGIKQNESNVAIGQLAAKQQQEWDKTVAGMMADGQTSYQQAVARATQVLGPRPQTLQAQAPGGAVPGGPAPMPQAPGGNPNDLLSRLGDRLAPGMNGKPNMGLPDFLTSVYKEDASNPGYFQNNRGMLVNKINTLYGPNALTGHLQGGGRIGGEVADFLGHLGSVSDQTAAEDAWRNALGINRGGSVLGRATSGTIRAIRGY